MTIRINAASVELQSSIIEIYANFITDTDSDGSPQRVRLFLMGRQGPVALPNIDITVDLTFDDAERIGNRLLSLVGKQSDHPVS